MVPRKFGSKKTSHMRLLKVDVKLQSVSNTALAQLLSRACMGFTKADIMAVRASLLAAAHARVPAGAGPSSFKGSSITQSAQGHLAHDL